MKEQRATLFSYVSGFVLSLICTGLAYTAATSMHSSSVLTLVFVLVLALLQLCVQLVFFLHLGKEKKSGWKIVIFVTTLIGMSILVVGSLWIMNHLNYSMNMQDNAAFIIHDEGMHK